MKKELLVVVISFLLLIISFSGCISDGVTAEEIKERFLQAVKTVTAYKYTGISNTLYTSTINGTESTAMNSDLSIICTTDIINKEMNINLTGDVEYMVESLANYSGELTEKYYYEGDSFYTPWIENNTWYPWGGENQWYSYAILESQADFIIQNSTLEKMDDEVIDEDDCYVLNLNTPSEALFLESSSTNFIFSQGGSPDRYLEIIIKYWISKDNNLLKKAYFKTLVNSTGFISQIPGDSQISLNELEVSFYNYNQPVDVLPPWQNFIDLAEETLGHLEYINTTYGYGLSPPEGCIRKDYQYEVRYKIEDLSLSFSIRPPIKDTFHRDEENLSSEVARLLEYYTNESTENFTLISHSERTINEMNAHEFVISSTYYGSWKIKNVYVEKGDRLFTLEYKTKPEYYDLYKSIVNESINSFMIVSPYYSISLF